MLKRRDVPATFSGEHPELLADRVRHRASDVGHENLPERSRYPRVVRNLVHVAARNRDELVHRAAPRGRRGVDVAQVDGERVRVVLHDAAGEPGHERVDLLRVVLSDGGVSLGVGSFLFELSTFFRM